MNNQAYYKLFRYLRQFSAVPLANKTNDIVNSKYFSLTTDLEYNFCLKYESYDT